MGFAKDKGKLNANKESGVMNNEIECWRDRLNSTEQNLIKDSTDLQMSRNFPQNNNDVSLYNSNIKE